MKIKGIRVWSGYVEKALKIERENSKRLHEEVAEIAKDVNISSGKQVAEFLVSKGVDVPRKDVTENAIKQGKKWEDKRQSLITEVESGELKERSKLSKLKQIAVAEEKINGYRKGNYQTDKKTLAKLLQNTRI